MLESSLITVWAVATTVIPIKHLTSSAAESRVVSIVWPSPSRPPPPRLSLPLSCNCVPAERCPCCQRLENPPERLRFSTSI